MKTKFADDANDTNDTKTKPKRKQSSGAIAWYVIILFNLTSIFGMVITLFFSLYFAASDCYFFLILAVLGILYYAWIVYRILIPTGYVPVIRIKGKGCHYHCKLFCADCLFSHWRSHHNL